jgi:hypothetical protein
VLHGPQLLEVRSACPPLVDVRDAYSTEADKGGGCTPLEGDCVIIPRGVLFFDKKILGLREKSVT